MKRFVSSVLLAGQLLWGCGSAFAQAPASENARPLAGKVIVIDPGHAVLSDVGLLLNPGARSRHGALERDVALSVSEKIVPLLEAQGARVYLTRTHDNPWRYGQHKHDDNRARAIFANVLHANAYVRVHCDWNRFRKFQGFTTYYFRWGSRRLAKHLREAFVQAFPDHRDNGIHRRAFVSATSTMPTVLMEIGVLSNKREGKDLAGEAYQSRAAQAICNGLVSYFSDRRLMNRPTTRRI